MGVVVKRYIDFLIILLIRIPLVLALFCSSIPTSLFIFKCFFIIFNVIFVQYNKCCSKNIRERSKIEITRRWRYKLYRQERTSTVRASPETSTCEVPRDVSRKLQLTLCAIMASEK